VVTLTALQALEKLKKVDVELADTFRPHVERRQKPR
jgi:hypothetical protein